MQAEQDCALDIGSDVALKRAAARGDGSEVCGANKQLVVVFEEKRPLRSVELRSRALRLDGIVAVDLSRRDLSARELAAGRHGWGT